jgi:hypothetical protein
MKPKIREITADENIYPWLVTEFDSDFHLLKAWANGAKTHPWCTFEKRSDHP